MLVQEDRKLKWKPLMVIAATGALSVYTVITLQGPHGFGALRVKVAKIHELQEQQSNLAKELEEKRKRVKSLENGQNIEMEMHRFGHTLPGEVEYKVAEPKVDAPADDAEPAKR